MSASLFGEAAAVFGPSEIANLSDAYNQALSYMNEEGAEIAIPGHQLRRQLASRIIEEARSGHSDPRLLAERAVASLAVQAH